MLQPPPMMPPHLSLPLLWKGDLLGLFEAASREGPILRLDGALFRLYQVNDPGLIREVLLDKEKRYRKGKLMRSLSVVTGEGLLINDGALWKRHRRLANPAFSPRKLDGYAGFMMESAEVLIQRWQEAQDGASVDLLEEMSEITLIALLRSIFGIAFDEAYGEVSGVIHALLEAVVQRGRSFFPLPLSFPTPANLRFRKQIAAADGILDAIVQARKGSPDEQPADLLGQWLEHTAGEGADGFSPEEMRDELMTMLIAGHHSLAIALSWSLYEIARRPEVQQRWHREIDGLDAIPVGHEALELLPYTQGIFLEALRFYPQPPILLRDAMCDHPLGEYAIAQGDQLLLNALAIHRDPSLWPEPERFLPERYQGEREASMQHHYLSFGGGSRTCIGRRFAILEGVLLLARIGQCFQLRPCSDEPNPPRFAAMMVPTSPLKLRWSRR